MNTFLGLTGENWIDLGISALIVVLAIIFSGRLVRDLVRRIVRRSATTSDDPFINATRTQVHWMVLVASCQVATFRLALLSDPWRQFLVTVLSVLYLGAALVKPVE